MGRFVTVRDTVVHRVVPAGRVVEHQAARGVGVPVREAVREQIRTRATGLIADCTGLVRMVCVIVQTVTPE